MRDIKCLYCNTALNLIKSQKIQLGQAGWIFDDLPNILAGALEVDIYSCPKCGKIEFFQQENSNRENQIAQIKCPKCGRLHDIDYPKCPFCKFEY